MRSLWLVLLMVPLAVGATDWQVDLQRSELGFVATWEGEPFDGTFKDYSPLIRFDAAKPDEAYVDFIVDVTSVDTGNSERDEGMADPEWFDFARFPEAYFRAKGAKPLGGTQYRIDGVLTVKGEQRPLSLDVDWQSADGQVGLSGEAIVDRREFGLGEGDWLEDSSIGFEVRIRFALVLMPKS